MHVTLFYLTLQLMKDVLSDFPWSFRSNTLVINNFITLTLEDTNVYFINIKYLSFMSFQRNMQKPICVRGTLLCSCENLMGNIRLSWERFRTDFYFSGLKSLFKRKKKKKDYTSNILNLYFPSKKSKL